MFSSASSTEKRGSTPKYTDASPCVEVQVHHQRRLPGRLLQRGREVDGDRRAAQPALGAHDGEGLAGRRLLERACDAADRGVDLRRRQRLAQPLVDALTASPRASPPGPCVLATMTMPLAGNWRLSTPTSRGRPCRSRMSMRKTSGPFDPVGCFDFNRFESQQVRQIAQAPAASGGAAGLASRRSKQWGPYPT